MDNFKRIARFEIVSFDQFKNSFEDKNDDENWRGYAQQVEFNYSTIKTATPMQILQMNCI